MIIGQRGTSDIFNGSPTGDRHINRLTESGVLFNSTIMLASLGDSSHTKALFIFIVVLALVTRMVGISFGLPYLYHVDEARFAKISITYFSGDLNPHFFHVPSLHTYMVAGLWGGYYIYGKISGKFSSITDFMESFDEDATPYAIIARLLSVLLGIGTILLVFYLGKKMYSPRVGILASLFLIVSPVHSKISHYMVPDVPMVFFILISFVCIWFIYTKGDTKFYILAGLFAGIATATKFGGQLLFLPLFLAHIFYVLGKKQSVKNIFFSHKLILSVVFFFGGFLAGCPYAVLDFPKFWNDFKWQSQHLLQVGHYGSSTAQPAWLFYIKYGLAENVGKFIQYLVFGGVLYGLIRRRKKDLILIVFPLVLFVLIGSWKSMAARYLLPLIPFFCLIAALFLDVILSKLKALLGGYDSTSMFHEGMNKILICSVVIVLLIPNALKITRFNYLLTQEDTRTVAKKWINTNLQRDSSIALESYGPPLSREDYSLIRRHTLGNVHLDWLAQRKVEYVIVSDIMYARFLRYPAEFPKQARFYKSLDDQTVLIKTFTPKWDEYLIDLHNPTLKVYLLSPYPNYTFPGNFDQYAQSVNFIKGESEEWKLQSSIKYTGLLDGSETVKNPYVKIVDSEGDEVLKFYVHEGDMATSDRYSSIGASESFSLSVGDKIYIGYEYDLLFDTSDFDLSEPLIKEYLLLDTIKGSTLVKRKILKFIFLYASFPNTRGDEYFQVVTLSKDSAVWTLFSTVFGGELRIGDDFVLNPFVQITDVDGNEFKKMSIFKGRVGSYEAKRRAFSQKSLRFSSLPKNFRVFVGYDSYYDNQYPAYAGGPTVIEIAVPQYEEVK
jgi:hypothetical protein